MTIQNLFAQSLFTMIDGSTISSVLDRTNVPVQKQSLAEARVAAGGRKERHYHKIAEELYFILEGAGEIELDGERRINGPGDAILIPSGTWHTITAYRAATLPLLLRAAFTRTRLRIWNNRWVDGFGRQLEEGV